MSQSAAPVSVSLVALQESAPAFLYGAHEVFSAVGTAWPALTGERCDGRRFLPIIVAHHLEPFRCAGGLLIAPLARLAQIQRTDIVVVGDLKLDLASDPRGRWCDTARWIRAQFERGATICSVRTGSVLLANTGLLDGLCVTTHRSALRTFHTFYPQIALQVDRPLSMCGPDRRIVTGGDAASWEDLVLYLIARFCSAAEAVKIAKSFRFSHCSDAQLGYAAMPRIRRHEDAAIAASQVWIAQHYSDERALAAMVARSGLAGRTFARRFKTATGYTPIDYLQALRVEEAKQLLETGNATTEAVASEIGYADPLHFDACSSA